MLRITRQDEACEQRPRGPSGTKIPQTCQLHHSLRDWPFRFRDERGQKSESERIRFAKRNEAFRFAGRKPLKSLCAANHDFAGSFVFNGLSAVSFRDFLACGSFA
jgi:hypothetical protein